MAVQSHQSESPGMPDGATSSSESGRGTTTGGRRKERLGVGMVCSRGMAEGFHRMAISEGRGSKLG